MKDLLQGEAIALAVSGTYEAVVETGVTAHPARKPYPKECRRYVIPIAKGGVIEWVFEVEQSLECLPGEIETEADKLDERMKSALLSYHRQRSGSFHYADEVYRFYLMKKAASISSPNLRKGIQVSARVRLEEMDLNPLADIDSSKASDTQIRIVPMDSAAIGNQTYGQFFLETVPNRGGRYYFSKKSLNAPAGSLLLFQFENCLVAMARLLEKHKRPVVNEWGEEQGGYYLLDPASVRVAETPLSLDAFRVLVPEFQGKTFSNAMHSIPIGYESSIVDAFGSSGEADDGLPELTSVVEAGVEGKKVLYYTTKYERDPGNRALAIKIHGTKCRACGFDFEETYGELGKGFIEVHHVKPLFSLDGEAAVDPSNDMVCLCSNCHRMVHRKKGTVLSVEELSALIAESAKICVALGEREQDHGRAVDETKGLCL